MEGRAELWVMTQPDPNALTVTFPDCLAGVDHLTSETNPGSPVRVAVRRLITLAQCCTLQITVLVWNGKFWSRQDQIVLGSFR